MVNIQIDGQSLQVEEGMTILQAARLADTVVESAVRMSARRIEVK